MSRDLEGAGQLSVSGAINKTHNKCAENFNLSGTQTGVHLGCLNNNNDCALKLIRLPY